MARPLDPSRDVYANLLRDTRGMRREQASARDAWYAALPWDHKEETLFELEMLLKSFACFGNPRNHAGPPRKTPAVAHDFRDELRIVRDALQEAIAQTRQLLGPKDRAYVFTRYLETVLPEDKERSKLVRDQLSQDTPDESLFVLRNAFGSFVEIADGLMRLGRIPHRTYFAFLGTITREIGRSAYFNPLVSLEFRPELDRIRHPEVLEILHAVPNDAAHRIAALSYLTLFRALRYLGLVEGYATTPETVRRAYSILAVLRSDIRALHRFLVTRAGDVLATGFERELFRVGADGIASSFDSLTEEAGALIALRGTLGSLGHGLRLDVRRVLERELPAPDAGTSDEELATRVMAATAQLRATFQHAIASLSRELAPSLRAPTLALDEVSRAATSERLRRDVWMFSHVLRAFLAKADAARADADRWESFASFQFVREFLTHFRAIGYQLVRHSDYGHLDRFLTELEALRDVDLLEPGRLAIAVEECARFHEYLETLFAKISLRGEIANIPFDKRAAAETMRIYLGAA